MDRNWLLTNTSYGTWLPGAEPGFVGQVWEHRPGESIDDRRVTHNIPETPYDEAIEGLKKKSRELMKGPPIYLERPHAEVLLKQLLETAQIRGWHIYAVAIMSNHFHIVVGVKGDPKPGKILGDFKSWGTRALSRKFGEPPSETWWTERGSKRKLVDEAALNGAIHYVLYQQPKPLLTWSPETGLHFGIPLFSGTASVEA
jgi:REP element-mobilizing transposase RayT